MSVVKIDDPILGNHYYGTKYESYTKQLSYDEMSPTKEQRGHNATIIKEWLQDAGWHIVSICAVLGNMEHESYLNPGLYESGKKSASSGYGLVQWTPSSTYTTSEGKEKKGNYIDTLYGKAARAAGEQSLISYQLMQLVTESRNGIENGKQVVEKQYYSSAAFLKPYKTSLPTAYSKGLDSNWSDFIGANGDSSFIDSCTIDTMTEIFAICYLRPNYTALMNSIKARKNYAKNWYEFFTGTTPTSENPQIINFEPKLTDADAPTKSKYYTTSRDSYKGINPYKTYPNYSPSPPWEGSVLPNCTGYAWGRIAEVLQIDKASDHPFYAWKTEAKTDNACNWFGHEEDGLERGDKPRVGAIACWDLRDENDSGGHVAFVEEVYSDGTFLVSESMWAYDVFGTVPLSAGVRNRRPFLGFIYVLDEYTESFPPPQLTLYTNTKEHGWQHINDVFAKVDKKWKPISDVYYKKNGYWFQLKK